MFCPFLKKRFYLFSERRGGRGKGRETSMCERDMDQLCLACPLPGTWSATQARALTGNLTGDLLVHRLVLSPLSHTSQGCKLTFAHLLNATVLSLCLSDYRIP